MNIPYFRPSIGTEEKERVRAVLDSGWLTSGTAVAEFETKFAEFIGVPHAVALNSCTAGLHLSLDAVGVRAGDAVLVPTMTFGATAAVVRHLGGRPILVDCDQETLTMDPSALQSAIENWRSDSAIKAVIPMHYGGQMADMNRVSNIAAKHSLSVIEDAAHALPASFKDSDGAWKSVGTTSPLASFSFYANKCITTGEGGMVTSLDSDLADRVRTMSLHGLSKSAWTRFENKGSWYYDIVEPGYKYNLTDLAAAIGIAQLGKANEFCARRTEIARGYTQQLAGCAEWIETPRVRSDRKSSWHIYGIRLNLDQLTIDRAEFIQKLRGRGITCSVHWMPLHLHPYYRTQYRYQESDFPVASREWMRMLSLPIFPSMTDSEVDYICTSVLEVAEDHRVRKIFPVRQEGIPMHQNGAHGD